MASTPQEIFQHHAEALMAGDVDEIVADYTDDAVIITPKGALRGKDGARQAFTELFADLPSAKWDVPTQILEGDVLFLEWTAETSTARVRDGIATLVFTGEGIRLQTERYTLEPLT
jgi:ketosteroid isomerase-like protein